MRVHSKAWSVGRTAGRSQVQKGRNPVFAAQMGSGIRKSPIGVHFDSTLYYLYWSADSEGLPFSFVH